MGDSSAVIVESPPPEDLSKSNPPLPSSHFHGQSSPTGKSPSHTLLTKNTLSHKKLESMSASNIPSELQSPELIALSTPSQNSSSNNNRGKIRVKTFVNLPPASSPTKSPSTNNNTRINALSFRKIEDSKQSSPPAAVTVTATATATANGVIGRSNSPKKHPTMIFTGRRSLTMKQFQQQLPRLLASTSPTTTQNPLNEQQLISTQPPFQAYPPVSVVLATFKQQTQTLTRLQQQQQQQQQFSQHAYQALSHAPQSQPRSRRNSLMNSFCYFGDVAQVAQASSPELNSTHHFPQSKRTMYDDSLVDWRKFSQTVTGGSLLSEEPKRTNQQRVTNNKKHTTTLFLNIGNKKLNLLELQRIKTKSDSNLIPVTPLPLAPTAAAASTEDSPVATLSPALLQQQQQQNLLDSTTVVSPQTLIEPATKIPAFTANGTITSTTTTNNNQLANGSTFPDAESNSPSGSAWNRINLALMRRKSCECVCCGGQNHRQRMLQDLPFIPAQQKRIRDIKSKISTILAAPSRPHITTMAQLPSKVSPPASPTKSMHFFSSSSPLHPQPPAAAAASQKFAQSQSMQYLSSMKSFRIPSLDDFKKKPDLSASNIKIQEDILQFHPTHQTTSNALVTSSGVPAFLAQTNNQQQHVHHPGDELIPRNNRSFNTSIDLAKPIEEVILEDQKYYESLPQALKASSKQNHRHFMGVTRPKATLSNHTHTLSQQTLNYNNSINSWKANVPQGISVSRKLPVMKSLAQFTYSMTSSVEPKVQQQQQQQSLVQMESLAEFRDRFQQKSDSFKTLTSFPVNLNSNSKRTLIELHTPALNANQQSNKVSAENSQPYFPMNDPRGLAEKDKVQQLQSQRQRKVNTPLASQDQFFPRHSSTHTLINTPIWSTTSTAATFSQLNSPTAMSNTPTQPGILNIQSKHIRLKQALTESENYLIPQQQQQQSLHSSKSSVIGAMTKYNSYLKPYSLGTTDKSYFGASSSNQNSNYNQLQINNNNNNNNHGTKNNFPSEMKAWNELYKEIESSIKMSTKSARRKPSNNPTQNNVGVSNENASVPKTKSTPISIANVARVQATPTAVSNTSIIPTNSIPEVKHQPRQSLKKMSLVEENDNEFAIKSLKELDQFSENQTIQFNPPQSSTNKTVQNSTRSVRDNPILTNSKTQEQQTKKTMLLNRQHQQLEKLPKKK